MLEKKKESNLSNLISLALLLGLFSYTITSSIIVLLEFEIIKSDIFFRKFLSKIKFCPSDFLVFIDNLSIFYVGFNSNIS